MKKKENSVISRMLKRTTLLLFALSLALAVKGQITITGTVIDQTGETIIGATVMVKNETTGTITDLDGQYSISVPDENATLIFSYIGYATQEVPVGQKQVIDIRLLEDTHTIDEVVVVGYGTQKKVNLTGSIAQVDSKVFKNRPVTSATSALQGALPGLNINPKSGNPNSDLALNIRGTTSINGGGPLVLIDGVEADLKLLNPNDIENVTVLKDAAASSIYGVRAAFGVILITTKRGEASDRLKINISSNIGWDKATVMPDFVDDSYTHATFVNEALRREGLADMFKPDHLEAIKAYSEDHNKPDHIIITDKNGKNPIYEYAGHYNWVDRLIKDYTPSTQHNISISGGSGKTLFYTSFGHNTQEGVLKINNDKYQRTNARLSVENRTYDWMKLGLRTQYNVSEMNEPHKYKDEFFHTIVFSSPLRGGQYGGDPQYPELDKYKGFYFEDQSPEGYLRYGGRNIFKKEEIILSPSIDLYVTKNWNIHLDYSYSKQIGGDKIQRKRIDHFIDKRFNRTEGNSNNNELTVVHSGREYQSFNAFTDYSFLLADKHQFKVMVGFNQESTKFNKTIASRKLLLSQDLHSLSLGSGEKTVMSDGYEWSLRGGFSRINYDYEGRYLVELNGRYDGTSRFPYKRRFTFLPSFSLGWRLSEEAWMAFSKPLFSNIKLRGSYGMLGNQFLSSSDLWKGNTKYYPYIPFMSNGLTGNYVFGSEQEGQINPPGLIPGSLTWEKSATINGGIDLTLLSSRMDISFDIYRRTTSDMLIAQEYPDLLGATAPVKNSGELQTNGWELSVKWRDNIGKDLSYNLGFTLFDSQAEITKYDGIKATINDYYQGKKIGEIWGFETVGFFDSEEEVASSPSQASINGGKWTPGDIRYKDLNGDGAITKGKNTVEDPGDQRIIGNMTPRYNYGLSAGITYKNFFFNIFLQGVGKGSYFPEAPAFWPITSQYFNTQKWFITDSWSPENKDAYFAIPRARNSKNRVPQTKYLQDVSYLRLKNMTFGYHLEKRWIEKLKMSSAQIYFSGENLWEYSKVKGPFDPEGMTNRGAMHYPFKRTYSIGIDITF